MEKLKSLVYDQAKKTIGDRYKYQKNRDFDGNIRQGSGPGAGTGFFTNTAFRRIRA